MQAKTALLKILYTLNCFFAAYHNFHKTYLLLNSGFKKLIFASHIINWFGKNYLAGILQYNNYTNKFTTLFK